MILSAQSIRSRKGIITPFCERTRVNGLSYGLSPAGYDIRIFESVLIMRQGFQLASSLEYFNVPNDILAKVADKSTWARQGLAVQNTIIEPGWRGFLTLELTNHGNDLITIRAGTPIAQIIFELLDKPTEQPYEGKYQDQPAGPVEAIYDKPKNS